MRKVPVLAVLASLILAAGLSVVPTTTAVGAPETGANVVTLENRRTGTVRWQIPWPGKTVADDVSQQVKGYASATSVRQGQPIELHVSTRPASTFTWHVYRLGWYGGLGGRLVVSGSATGVTQPTCPRNSTTGTIECRWSRSVSVPTSTSWTSGLYVVVLTAGAYQNYVPVTVRDDRKAGILVLQPTNTYQAYNNYPDDRTTGKSLYAYNSYGPTTVGGSTAAVKVSYDRPYARSGASTLVRDEAPFVRYVESRGFDVTYATDVDLHATPAIASGQRSIAPIGHSEYWSVPMYDTALAARDAGVSITSFGANSIYWHIRMESSGPGVPNRVIVSYRTSASDPVTDPAMETVQFRQLGKPEQLILGEMFASPNGLVPKDHPWVVSAAGSWFYRGTGLSNGQTIRAIVGGETDYRQKGYAFPASTVSYVLAHSPVVNQYGGSGVAESTLYRSPSSAWVFDAGSLRYTWALDSPGYVDPRAQAMTTNLLARTSGFASSVATQRLAGADRYATAAAISADTFSPGVPVVYVATGSDFPDALAATAATLGQGPVLPVRRDDVPPPIEAELVRLQPASVVVVGSSAVVSDAVLARIAAVTGTVPVRRAGADRFATAAAVSAARFGPGVPTLYIATGMNFPDALSAGAAGAQVGGPVLLAAGTGLTTPTLNEIARLQPKRIVIVGSSAVVPGFLDSYLASTAPVVRLAGTDRYATSQAVGRDLHSAGSAPFVALATGTNYPDALAGGAAVAHRAGGLIIVHTVLTTSVAEEIVRSAPERVAFLGSDAVVSADVARAVGRLFDVVDGVPSPVVVDPPVPVPQQVFSDGLDEPLFRDDAATELPWLDR